MYRAHSCVLQILFNLYINLYKQLYIINYIAQRREEGSGNIQILNMYTQHVYTLCRYCNAEIFARRISTSLLRRPSERRTTPVREKRHDYIFSAGINPPYGCLRVCLPSCRAAAFYIRVWNQYRVATRYAIGFLPKSRTTSTCMYIYMCVRVYACVRVCTCVRTSMEIAMIFEAFPVV